MESYMHQLFETAIMLYMGVPGDYSIDFPQESEKEVKQTDGDKARALNDAKGAKKAEEAKGAGAKKGKAGVPILKSKL